MTFNEVLDEARVLRDEKNKEYGSAYSAFYTKFGMVGLHADLYRKFARLDSLTLKSNSLRDTLLDIGVMAFNAVAWLDSRKGGD